MRIARFITTVALLLAAPAMAQEIPPGVNYTKGSPELNDQTQKRLEAVFAQNPIKLESLLAKPVICAPEPWQTLKPHKEELFKGMKIAPANMIVTSDGRQQSFEGALFQTDEQVAAFSKGMEKYLASGGPYQIRKATSEELSTYWAMIPYDIVEPLFVADNSEHKLLMQFGEDGKSIFWIGDLQHVHFKKK